VVYLVGFHGNVRRPWILWLFLIYQEIERGPEKGAPAVAGQCRPDALIEEEAMGTVWFCLVAVMVAMYVVLDGFDLGAGAIHFLVAKTEEERRQVIASIGRVWDGNEVWRVARSILHFRCFMPMGSVASTSR
jgi:hypothetical protein